MTPARADGAAPLSPRPEHDAASFALSLGAVCHAYGVGLSIAELLVVNVGASLLAGFIPVPGGVGSRRSHTHCRTGRIRRR